MTLVPGYWSYDIKRMLQFLVLLALFMLPVLNREIRQLCFFYVSRIPRPVSRALLIVFALGVLSAFLNATSPIHFANSFADIALLCVLVFAVIVIAACRVATGAVFDQVAVGLIAVTVLAVGFQEFVGVAAAHLNDMDFNYDVALIHFSKPRFFNQFQSWAMPVVAALPLLFPRNRSVHWMTLLVLALLWYILLMTAGRGTAVALAFAFTFAFIFFPFLRSYLFKWQAVGLLAGGLIYLLVLSSFEISGNQQDEAPLAGAETTSRYFEESLGRPMLHTSGRSWMWFVSLRDVKQHPVLGIGPYNYSCTRDYWFAHPHSFPVQFVAEWGLLALALVLAVTAWMLIRVTQALRNDDPGEVKDPKFAALLFVSACAASVHACLSGVLIMPASQVVGLLVCGLLLAKLPVNDIEVKPASAHYGALITPLALSVFLMSLGGIELTTMQERANRLPPHVIAPRMWQDAKVCTTYTQTSLVTN